MNNNSPFDKKTPVPTFFPCYFVLYVVTWKTKKNYQSITENMRLMISDYPFLWLNAIHIADHTETIEHYWPFEF